MNSTDRSGKPLPRRAIRLQRQTRLSPQEAARQAELRRLVMEEFPPADGSPAALHLELRNAVAALREARLALGLTLPQTAKRSGLAASQIKSMESERIADVSFDQLRRLADALGRRLKVAVA